MDFKHYYHNKLNEEGIAIKNPDGTYDLDQDAPKPQPPQQPAANGGLIFTYVSGKSMKEGLSKLAEEIGKNIFEYSTKQLVQQTDFKSEDDYLKYCKDIRDGVEEKYNKTLVELMTQIGIFIDNKVHTQSMK